MSYVATAFYRSLKPYDWYHSLVIAGAKQHGLPKEWIAGLQRTAFDVDTDLKRKNRLEALEFLRAAGYVERSDEAVAFAT